jgi:Fe2+ transport system protein FeoA
MTPKNPIPLTALGIGQGARFHGSKLDGAEEAMLSALGFAAGRPLRLCKAGNPWIVQVATTRVGLSPAVAQRVLVVPEAQQR